LRRTAIAALLASLVLAPGAHADGDPASDYLLGSPIFLPPDVVIPQADAKQLVDQVAAVKARGFEIRVAVTGTRYDLGSVGALFRQPRRYAAFLGQELRFVYKGRLLVVMPNGLGVSQAGKPAPAAQAVVDRVAPPGTSGPALARAAAAAVHALAADSGVDVPLGAASRPGSQNTALVAVVLVAVVLLCGAGAALVVRRRRLGVGA
jgi:hypothetical protein